jgi:drug/metabolite transporter (DMT)-like permease
MMRKISATDNSFKSIYYYFFISTIISGVIAIPELHEIAHSSFMLLVEMSVLFFFVQYFLVLAASYATAQVVSSMYYSNIIFSLIFSIFLLNSALTISVFIGMVCIVVGGMGVIYLQRKSNNKTMQQVRLV